MSDEAKGFLLAAELSMLFWVALGLLVAASL